ARRRRPGSTGAPWSGASRLTERRGRRWGDLAALARHAAVQSSRSRIMQRMKLNLPNSASLENVKGFLRQYSPDDPTRLDFTMHDRWVAVHPAVLAMTACAAAVVRKENGAVNGKVEPVRSLPYLIRMGLFDHLGIDPGKAIEEHEAAGR